jgi:hypothetical protein
MIGYDILFIALCCIFILGIYLFSDYIKNGRCFCKKDNNFLDYDNYYSSGTSLV